VSSIVVRKHWKTGNRTCTCLVDALRRLGVLGNSGRLAAMAMKLVGTEMRLWQVRFVSIAAMQLIAPSGGCAVDCTESAGLQSIARA
jgi:hypothetical protein